MKYNHKINNENIKKFKKLDIFYDNETEKYQCVLCKRKTCISNSTSIMGHFLICNNCVYEKFGDYAKAREWQNKEYDNKEEK